jgi:hypothetical protein
LSSSSSSSSKSSSSSSYFIIRPPVYLKSKFSLDLLNITVHLEIDKKVKKSLKDEEM